MIKKGIAISLLAILLLLPSRVFAAPDAANASPKPGWGDFDVEEEDVSYPIWAQVLLWPVNRVVDFIDIFRVDAGVGASTGGVLRVTRGLQMGYRDAGGGSLRLGLMGRHFPILLRKRVKVDLQVDFKNQVIGISAMESLPLD